MTHTKPPKGTVQNRYNILMAENMMMLEEITKEMRTRKDFTGVNGGDVGDAAHYHEQIKEIRDQLLKLGEYA